jgi:nucleotide-binding universal stress UspA family protein
MDARKIVVLIDGMHSRELLGELDDVVRVSGAELLLVYVRGRGPRSGLDLVRRRPGGLRMPPHRQQAIAEAEEVRGSEAIDEAGRIAEQLGARVRKVVVDGEAGQVVTELARREQADAVAVRAGGRDRPPMGPGSLGPAARFIADHCKCTVVLLRDRP